MRRKANRLDTGTSSSLSNCFKNNTDSSFSPCCLRVRLPACLLACVPLSLASSLSPVSCFSGAPLAPGRIWERGRANDAAVAARFNNFFFPSTPVDNETQARKNAGETNGWGGIATLLHAHSMRRPLQPCMRATHAWPSDAPDACTCKGRTQRTAPFKANR